MTYNAGKPELMIQDYIQRNPSMQIQCTKNMHGVLSSVQKLHSTTNVTRDKNKYLSLVAKHFSGRFLKSIGFKFSSSAFSNARKKKIQEIRHHTPPSKAPISIEKKRKINDFLLDNSTIASNKVKKIKISDYNLYFKGK